MLYFTTNSVTADGTTLAAITNAYSAHVEGASLAGPEGWRLALDPRNARKAAASGGTVTLGARHSAIALHREAKANTLPARVFTVEPTGDITFVHVRLGAATLVVSVPPETRVGADESVWLEIDQGKMHVFDGKTGMAL